MQALIVGLVIFFGLHSIAIVAPDWRSRMLARLGEGAWKGIYSVLSIAGFLLSSLLGLALSLRSFAAVAQFTQLTGLRDWLLFYACFSTAMFGAASVSYTHLTLPTIYSV